MYVIVIVGLLMLKAKRYNELVQVFFPHVHYNLRQLSNSVILAE